MKILSERKTEIKRMINNEFSERKSRLIKELEDKKDPSMYIENLEREEYNFNIVIKAVDKYFK